MKSMHLLPLSIAGILVSFSAAAQAVANDPPNWPETVSKRNFALIAKGLQGAEAANVEKALLEATAKNDVQSMWMLGNHMWVTGRKADGAKWLYTARLGTLMDAQSCFEVAARNETDKLMGHFYSIRLREIARDFGLHQRSVKDAIIFQNANIRKAYRPNWTCKYWAKAMGKPGMDSAAMGGFGQRRFEALSAFAKVTGNAHLFDGHATDPKTGKPVTKDPFRESFHSGSSGR